jgi:transposase-like protein
MKNKYLTTQQVAQEFGISPNTLRKHRAEGRGFPFTKVGEVPGNKKTGTVLYDRALVEEVINKGAQYGKYKNH